MRAYAVTAACAVVFASVPINAQRPATAVARSPLALDVAGVRLGMPIAQARAALGATWRCVPQKGETTFEQKVADEVHRRRTGSTGRWGGGLGVSFDRCTGPAGEELTISYAEVAGGAVVDEFRLSLPRGRFDAAEVRRGLLAKFGRPTVSDAGDGSWCDAGYRCDQAFVFTEGPKVALTENPWAVVAEGRRGNRAKTADAAAVTAAADREAPTASGAAF